MEIPASRGGLPLVRPVHPARPWIVGAVYLLALIPLSAAPKISGNVSSRYMTIESIVERGTLAIDRSPLLVPSGSPDIVKFGPHLYSDKPPVLAALATPLYSVLRLGGLRFGRFGPGFVLVNWVLVVGIVGVSSGLTLVGVRRLLQAVPIAPWAADLLSLGFGFGSPLLTYGVTFNNHSVAAGLITWALARTLLDAPGGWRQATIGMGVGLAATLDLPAGGVWLAALGLLLIERRRALPWGFAAGVLVPLIVHGVLQSQVTGTPLPAEMYPAAFEFPGSYWAKEGKWVETGPRWQFGLEFLVGPQGWLTITPVLAFGLIGVVSALRRPADPWKMAALAVGATTAILLVYYIWIVRRTDFSGASFGTRHLLAIAPAVFVCAVLGVVRLGSMPARVVFGLLMVVGAVYAVEGVRDPWSRVETLAPNRPALRVLQRAVLYPWSNYRRGSD